MGGERDLPELPPPSPSPPAAGPGEDTRSAGWQGRGLPNESRAPAAPPGSRPDSRTPALPRHSPPQARRSGGREGLNNSPTPYLALPELTRLTVWGAGPALKGRAAPERLKGPDSLRLPAPEDLSLSGFGPSPASRLPPAARGAAIRDMLMQLELRPGGFSSSGCS